MTTTTELAVNMTCGACEKAVDEALKATPGVERVEIDLGAQRVVVTGTALPDALVRVCEPTGRVAKVTGHQLAAASSSMVAAAANALAAVGQLTGHFTANAIRGVVRFVDGDVKQDEHTALVDIDLQAADAASQLTVEVHERGDLSSGAASVGGIYRAPHGVIASRAPLDGAGRLTMRVRAPTLRVADLIGRSLCVSSSTTPGVECAVIARSALVFENPKRICTCDGTEIWATGGDDEQTTTTTTTTTTKRAKV